MYEVAKKVGIYYAERPERMKHVRMISSWYHLSPRLLDSQVIFFWQGFPYLLAFLLACAQSFCIIHCPKY
jgi:hypothetical protein